MTELAMRSTSGTEPVAVDPGCRIAAVRADGGAVEILGRDAASGGAERRLRIEPTDRDLGWVVPPEDAVWTAFRAVGQGTTCFVELAPREG
jgi:hypothetical protein